MVLDINIAFHWIATLTSMNISRHLRQYCILQREKVIPRTFLFLFLTLMNPIVEQVIVDTINKVDTELRRISLEVKLTKRNCMHNLKNKIEYHDKKDSRLA